MGIDRLQGLRLEWCDPFATCVAAPADWRYHQGMETLKFWHGSQRWDGPPRHNPARPGCYECGPGLYLATCQATARKYARGAGKLVLVELDPDLRLLEDAVLSLEQMKQAIASLPRVRNRPALLKDLDEAAARHPKDQVPAIYLVNLCVNHEALPGRSGPVLAQWLADQGIDASIANQTSNDQWLVVFNLDKVRRSRPMTADEAWPLGDMPFLSEQQGALAPAPEQVSRGPKAPR